MEPHSKIRSLATRDYWESIHKREESSLEARHRSLGRAIVESIPVPGLAEFVTDFVRNGGYPEYLVDRLLIERHMPFCEDWKLLEVGSAPGWRLAKMHRLRGYIPYGVEYSKQGVELNRETFSANNLDPKRVIHADFFSEEFLNQYTGYFDVVASYGFIEHFDDPRSVVLRHIELLKKGGYLLVMIPNVHGLNYRIWKLFSPEILALHNLDIMNLQSFRGLFDLSELKTLYCDHIGVFYPPCPENPKGQTGKLLLRAMTPGIVLSGLALRLLFRTFHPETAWLSPFLAYLGQKL
jgi:SAM-dependent methyltransferase